MNRTVSERRKEFVRALRNIVGRKLRRRLKSTGCKAFHEILRGDSTKLLTNLPSRCLDAYVTDPPAGIDFMGKSWDCFRRANNEADVGRKNVFGRISRISPASGTESARDAFVFAMTKVFSKAYRVLKPGAHALVWAIPRTAHWTTWALEEAGFEIRDVIVHIQAQGMAKGLNVSKAIDAKHGNKRKVVGVDPVRASKLRSQMEKQKGGTWPGRKRTVEITEAGSSDSAKWEGWGTGLRPLAEHWIIARRPLEGTVVDNVLKYGTGALNIDACRVGSSSKGTSCHYWPEKCRGHGNKVLAQTFHGSPPKDWIKGAPSATGRWPPNFVFSHHPDCIQKGHRKVRSGTYVGKNVDPDAYQQNTTYGKGRKKDSRAAVGYAAKDGTEKVPKWKCVEGCPVLELEKQSPGSIKSYPQFAWSAVDIKDRFRYVGKITPKERSHDGALTNDHPTVKPRALMRWLIQLVCPRNGIVLDTFNGSGSTGIACMDLSISYVGMEREKPYVKITKRRFKHEARRILASNSDPKMKPLFQ